MQELFRLALVTRKWPVWLRYLCTTVLVILVLWIRLGLGGIMHGAHPFLLFFPAIIVAGVLFDHGSSIYATVLSAGLAAVMLLPPVDSLAISNVGDMVALAIFVFTALVTGALIESLHISYVRIDKAAHQRHVLLSELSHRMRNDLTMLVSLLRVQAKASDDPPVNAALTTTADRVQVLAKVHQRLTMSDDSVTVDTREYVTDLCDDLRRMGPKAVALKVAAESHPMGMDRAVLMGLIINELLTNALKHAFPGGRAGHVSVSLERPGDEFRLTVADDGAGLTEPPAGRHVGLRVVRLLAKQLSGRVETPAVEVGVTCLVTFPA